jgi:hypothetical protein
MSYRQRSRRRLNAAPLPSVRVRIDELLLNGFSPADRFEIGGGLQTELTRLLSDRGIPQPLSKPAEYTRLDAGTLSPSADHRASAIGTQVANAVYRTFQPGPEGGAQ